MRTPWLNERPQNLVAAILAAALSFLLGLYLGVQKCRPSVDRDGDAGFWEAGW